MPFENDEMLKIPSNLPTDADKLRAHFIKEGKIEDKPPEEPVNAKLDDRTAIRRNLYENLTEGMPGTDESAGIERPFRTFYYRGRDPLNGVGGVLERIQLLFDFQEVAVISDPSLEAPIGVTIIHGYKDRMSYTERLTGFSYQTP